MALSDDLERIAKQGQTAVAPPLSDEANRSTRCEENTAECVGSITRLLEEAFCQTLSDCKSLKRRQRTSEMVIEVSDEQADVLEMTKDDGFLLTDKLKHVGCL